MNLHTECMTLEELVGELMDEDLIRKSNMRMVYVDDKGNKHPIGTVSPIYTGETETVELHA